MWAPASESRRNLNNLSRPLESLKTKVVSATIAVLGWALMTGQVLLLRKKNGSKERNKETFCSTETELAQPIFAFAPKQWANYSGI